MNLPPTDAEILHAGVIRRVLKDGKILAFTIANGTADEISVWSAAVIEALTALESSLTCRTLHDLSTATTVAALDRLEEIMKVKRTQKSRHAFILPKTIFAQDIQTKIEDKTNRYFAIRSRFFFNEGRAIEWLLQDF